MDINNTKKKAIELVGKFYEFNHIGNSHAKKCALIAVDEIIKVVDMCIPYHNKETYVSYWQEVKIEIQKL